MTSRNLLRGGLAAAVLGFSGVLLANNWPEKQGCDAYTPSSGTLVAHAGGGLTEAFYTNSRSALDQSAQYGFELIEIDFRQREDGRLALWHEGHPESDMRLEDLVIWLQDHPSIRIITDIKTDNLAGLQQIRTAAGELQDRFIVQIYDPSQYDAVRLLGFEDMILTIYLMSEHDTSWVAPANALDLMAVTMPADRRELAQAVDHFVFLHTVNEPLDGFGLYTDCLIPADPDILPGRSDGSEA